MGNNKIDLTGQTFGKLKVISFYKSIKGVKHWLCECKCGNTKIVSTSNLTSKHVRSCGCLVKDTHPYEDLTGKTFNMLTVKQYDHTDNSGHVYWSCTCDCANYTITSSDRLKHGYVKSCGCLRSIINKKPKLQYGIYTKYGRFTTRSPIIKTYKRMVNRCYNPNNDSYEYYKDIGIDPRWYDQQKKHNPRYIDSNGIINFIEDMYPSYEEHTSKYGFHNTSLDRINGKLGYSKENCRWATFVVQNNNLSTNRHVFDGEEILTFSECVRKYVPMNLLSEAYQKAPGNLFTTKLTRDWSVNQILAMLKHVKIDNRLLKKSELENIMIWKIDQSPVYEKYPDELRLPGYENS